MAEIKKTKDRKIKSKKIVLHKLTWLEYVAMGFSGWFLFYPTPYYILLVILLLIPIIGLVLNGLEKPSIASLVEIDRNSKNEYDVADFIDIPAFIIFLRAIIEFELDSVIAVIVTSGIAFILIVAFLFFTHKKIEASNKDKNWIYGSVIFCLYMYSYGAVVSINCSFDNSKPKVYASKIIEKHIRKGSKGRKTYYIKVLPWGHHYDAEDIKVSQSEYDHYIVNETVKIDYKEGLLGIPWYYLE